MKHEKAHESNAAAPSVCTCATAVLVTTKDCPVHQPRQADAPPERIKLLKQKASGFTVWMQDIGASSSAVEFVRADLAASYVVNCHSCGAKVELFPKDDATPAGEASPEYVAGFEAGCAFAMTRERKD